MIVLTDRVFMQGMCAWWRANIPVEKGGTWLSMIDNSQSLALHGDAEVLSSHWLSLPTLDDYAGYVDIPRLNSASAATIMCWFHKEPDDILWVGSRGSQPNEFGTRIKLAMAYGDVSFFAAGNQVIELDVLTGTWTHAAGVFDDDNDNMPLSLYINGEFENGEWLALHTLDDDAGVNFEIKAQTKQYAIPHHVDDVMLFDRALSESEINLIYRKTYHRSTAYP